MKYLDENGLLYTIQKIKSWLTGKVDKVDGKGLSTNDLTNELKAKYDTAVSKVDDLTETGGAPNVIEIVKVNGSPLTPDTNKAVDVVVPTKLSDLTNDDNTVKDASYVHTDNNYTTAEKNKLAGLQNYDDTELKNQIAQAGKIDTIKVNGSAQDVTNKTVELTIPTNNNQLTNGAGYKTESEVNSLIANAIGDIQGITYEVVSSLPSTGKAGIIYLVANSKTEVNNIYDEYIWNANSFEKIGTTAVDLSNYYTKSEMNAISNSEIDTIVA